MLQTAVVRWFMVSVSVRAPVKIAAGISLAGFPMAVAVCREAGRQRKQSLMEQMRAVK